MTPAPCQNTLSAGAGPSLGLSCFADTGNETEGLTVKNLTTQLVEADSPKKLEELMLALAENPEATKELVGSALYCMAVERMFEKIRKTTNSRPRRTPHSRSQPRSQRRDTRSSAGQLTNKDRLARLE